jgi:5'-3' exonuclease
MDCFGVSYCEAPGEADQLSAFLVNNGNVWGCISDDTDMFLYGCSYVIRNISLLNHTAILYDTTKILEELEMTNQIFSEIMVLSGTDYNIHSNTSLKETMRWYYKYLKYKQKNQQKYENECENECENSIDSFYIWLIKNTKYIRDYDKLIDVYKMFNFNSLLHLKEWENIEIINKPINKKGIMEIMEKEGFYFSG